MVDNAGSRETVSGVWTDAVQQQYKLPPFETTDLLRRQVFGDTLCRGSRRIITNLWVPLDQVEEPERLVDVVGHCVLLVVGCWLAGVCK
jgi:hypothetical protein